MKSLVAVEPTGEERRGDRNPANDVAARRDLARKAVHIHELGADLRRHRRDDLVDVGDARPDRRDLARRAGSRRPCSVPWSGRIEPSGRGSPVPPAACGIPMPWASSARGRQRHVVLLGERTVLAQQRDVGAVGGVDDVRLDRGDERPLASRRTRSSRRWWRSAAAGADRRAASCSRPGTAAFGVIVTPSSTTPVSTASMTSSPPTSTV